MILSSPQDFLPLLGNVGLKEERKKPEERPLEDIGITLDAKSKK